MIELDVVSAVTVLFSIGSAIVAFVSLYHSTLKRGRLSAVSPRMYKVEPNTWNGTRTLKVVLPVTLLNTGAGRKAITDLRLRVQTMSGPITLHWSEEHDELSIRDANAASPNHPRQPTVDSYESLAAIYGFTSHANDSSVIQALDDVQGGSALPATLEHRQGARSWRPLCGFTLHYAGRIALETDYDRIHGRA